MKKLFVFLSLFLIIKSSSCFGMKEHVGYSGIFDEDIYDQRGIRLVVASAPDSSPPEIELLKKKKLHQLRNKYIKTLTTLLESYKDTLALNDDNWLERILDDVRRNPVNAVIDVGWFVHHWWEGGTKQENKADSSKKTEVARKGDTPAKQTEGKRHAERGRIVDNPHIEMEILKIQTQIQERERGLEFEPVLDLEKQYVIVKKDIPLRLQKQIERSLLLYRECTGHTLEIERRFINCALSLPRSPKAIIRLASKKEDLRDIVTKTRSTFKTFSPDIVETLVDIAVEIAVNSVCDKSTYTGKRRTIRYFWGTPGGGKTSTILTLAHMLGLYCEQVKISSAHDLSPERLAGKDRFGDCRNTGWFLSPLLNSGGTGLKTYSNSFLLIDDIDLDISPDEVLSVLKLYLDPLTETFDSPYFDCPIDTDFMNIFVTSNSPIPRTKKYAALRSRVPEVEFPSFQITNESLVLKGYVATEARKMHLALTEKDTKLIINAAHSILKQKDQEPDLRSMKRIVEDLVRGVLIRSLNSTSSLDKEIEKFLSAKKINNFEYYLKYSAHSLCFFLKHTTYALYFFLTSMVKFFMYVGKSILVR